MRLCIVSAIDVSAAENIGRVLAQRCLQAGITRMLLEPLYNSDKSEKVKRRRRRRRLHWNLIITLILGAKRNEHYNEMRILNDVKRTVTDW